MGSSRDFDMFENTESGQPPLPTPSQGFLGIEIEIYLVFNAILSKLIVNMVRTTGIGRSSLVSALWQYINDQKSTMPKIKSFFYIRAPQSKKTDRIGSIIYPLHKRLVALGKATSLTKGAHIDEITQNIYKALSHMKLMVVFSRVEILEGSEEAQ